MKWFSSISLLFVIEGYFRVRYWPTAYAVSLRLEIPLGTKVFCKLEANYFVKVVTCRKFYRTEWTFGEEFITSTFLIFSISHPSLISLTFFSLMLLKYIRILVSYVILLGQSFRKTLFCLGFWGFTAQLFSVPIPVVLCKYYCCNSSLTLLVV